MTAFRSAQRHGQSRPARPGRTLKRDFGEVENLAGLAARARPTSSPSPTGRPEETLREELEKARPGYSFVGEEGGQHEGTDKTHHLDRRSARRHDQLPARHSAFRDLDRARARRHDRRRPRSTIRPTTSCSSPSAARAPSSTTGACGSPARRNLADCRDRPAACPISARGDLGLSAARDRRRCRPRRRLRRYGRAARSISACRRPAGRFDAYWERDLAA